MPDPAPPIIVASAVDEGYLPLTEVVAASIAASATTDRPVEYHVLYAGRSTWLVGHLRRFNRPPVTIHVHEMANPWERFGTINRFPPSALLRFSVEDVLTADRVLYLDADLIVESDLGALYDLPLNGHAVAAALDTNRTNVVANASDDSELAYARDTLEMGDAAMTYLQSGVMLLDLPALRRTGYKQRITAAIQRFGQTLRFPDQCAANHVLKGDYEVIDPRWNVNFERLEEERDPWISHYAGKKPWKILGLPASDRWWKVARSLPTFPLFVWGFIRYRGGRELDTLRRRLAKRARPA